MLKLSSVRLGIELVRHLGPGWVFFRAGYSIRQRQGWYARRWPATTWEQRPLASFLTRPELAQPDEYSRYRSREAPLFLFAPADRTAYAPLLRQWDDAAETPMHTAAQLAAGRLRFFERHWWEIGSPPAWQRNALTGETAPSDRHWSQLGDFGYGDIKVIWEPSRFGFAYALVRAYWRTGDEGYAEQFWQLVEDWRVHNPPYQGPNWRCGQETTFRVMAWCFGLYGFADAQATTPQRVHQLAQMIALSGERIASNLDYALSQRNNHGVSEGAGLWTIGILFPELRSAAGWREQGRQVLERLAQDLITEDGAFSQHSLNYHRVMLHDYLWALRLGDLNGQPLSAAVRERVHRAALLLYQLLNQADGAAPRYGANDGALVLPLDNCDHRDYRPVVQAAFYQTTGVRVQPRGPWDEALLWLGGLAALAAPEQPLAQQPISLPQGGYYTFRSTESFVFTRCGAFKERPGHADLLHVDLWWRGQNIAVDPGAYSYNAPPPWDDPLARTAYHNTVTVDGLDQMNRVSRFLWLPWARGWVRRQARSRQGVLSYWEGEHDGYRRLTAPVRHRRAVLGLGADVWLVIDDLDNAAAEREHSYRLHWLLHDYPYTADLAANQLALTTSGGSYYLQWGAEGAALSTLLRAADDGPRGWQAPYYLERTPALSLAAAVTGQRTRFWTVFAPLRLHVAQTAAGLHLDGAMFAATVTWAPTSAAALVQQIMLQQPTEEMLEL